MVDLAKLTDPMKVGLHPSWFGSSQHIFKVKSSCQKLFLRIAHDLQIPILLVRTGKSNLARHSITLILVILVIHICSFL